MNDPAVHVKSTSEIIKGVARELGRPITKEDVMPHVDLTEGSLDNKLSGMAKEGDLVRLKRGVYDLPENTPKELQSEVQVEGWREPVEEVEVVKCRVVVVCAGDGAEPEQFETRMVPAEEYRRDHQVSVPSNGKGSRWYAKVMGDSMAPEFFDGEYLPVELVNQPINRVRSSGVYVVYYEGVLELRRVQVLTSNRISLICTNPNYQNEVVEIDGGTQIIACARVKLRERDQLLGAMMRKIVE